MSNPQRAERILFLGFGFHSDNIRRFNFFKPEAVKGKEITATSLGLGAAAMEELLNRLQGFGLPNGMLTGHGCDSFFNAWTRLR